jgi:photosystem II stability/assembly factor-like uncharacterized protein
MVSWPRERGPHNINGGGPMQHRGRGSVVAAIALAVMVIAASTVTRPAVAAPIAYEPGAEWYPTGLTERVSRIMPIDDGTVYAVLSRYDTTEHQYVGKLWRTDDHGKTWRQITLPEHVRDAWVDPTDPAILYASPEYGLFKSTDGGTTWSPLTIAGFKEAEKEVFIGGVSVSRADHQLLYADALLGMESGLLRSPDGGLTWELAMMEPPMTISCRTSTTHILPHGGDADRIARVSGCSSVGNDIAGVSESSDRGTTWEDHGTPLISGHLSDVEEFVGFRGAMPERLYALTMHSDRVGYRQNSPSLGHAVFRSDDAGRTWTEILSTVQPGQYETAPTITALTYDPNYPQVVCVAMGTRVQYSQSAGASWNTIGRRELPPVSALAIDATWNYLYAATDDGIFYLNLPV